MSPDSALTKTLNSPVMLSGLAGGIGVAVLLAFGTVVREFIKVNQRRDQPRPPWERF